MNNKAKVLNAGSTRINISEVSNMQIKNYELSLSPKKDTKASNQSSVDEVKVKEYLLSRVDDVDPNKADNREIVDQLIQKINFCQPSMLMDMHDHIKDSSDDAYFAGVLASFRSEILEKFRDNGEYRKFIAQEAKDVQEVVNNQSYVHTFANTRCGFKSSMLDSLAANKNSSSGKYVEYNKKLEALLKKHINAEYSLGKFVGYVLSTISKQLRALNVNSSIIYNGDLSCTLEDYAEVIRIMNLTNTPVNIKFRLNKEEISSLIAGSSYQVAKCVRPDRGKELFTEGKRLLYCVRTNGQCHITIMLADDQLIDVVLEKNQYRLTAQGVLVVDKKMLDEVNKATSYLFLNIKRLILDALKADENGLLRHRHESYTYVIDLGQEQITYNLYNISGQLNFEVMDNTTKTFYDPALFCNDTCTQLIQNLSHEHLIALTCHGLRAYTHWNVKGNNERSRLLEAIVASPRAKDIPEILKATISRAAVVNNDMDFASILLKKDCFRWSLLYDWDSNEYLHNEHMLYMNDSLMTPQHLVGSYVTRDDIRKVFNHFGQDIQSLLSSLLIVSFDPNKVVDYCALGLLPQSISYAMRLKEIFVWLCVCLNDLDTAKRVPTVIEIIKFLAKQNSSTVISGAQKRALKSAIDFVISYTLSGAHELFRDKSDYSKIADALINSGLMHDNVDALKLLVVQDKFVGQYISFIDKLAQNNHIRDNLKYVLSTNVVTAQSDENVRDYGSLLGEKLICVSVPHKLSHIIGRNMLTELSAAIAAASNKDELANATVRTAVHAGVSNEFRALVAAAASSAGDNNLDSGDEQDNQLSSGQVHVRKPLGLLSHPLMKKYHGLDHGTSNSSTAHDANAATTLVPEVRDNKAKQITTYTVRDDKGAFVVHVKLCVGMMPELYVQHEDSHIKIPIDLTSRDSAEFTKILPFNIRIEIICALCAVVSYDQQKILQALEHLNLQTGENIATLSMRLISAATGKVDIYKHLMSGKINLLPDYHTSKTDCFWMQSILRRYTECDNYLDAYDRMFKQILTDDRHADLVRGFVDAVCGHIAQAKVALGDVFLNSRYGKIAGNTGITISIDNHIRLLSKLLWVAAKQRKLQVVLDALQNNIDHLKSRHGMVLSQIHLNVLSYMIANLPDQESAVALREFCRKVKFDDVPVVSLELMDRNWLMTHPVTVAMLLINKNIGVFDDMDPNAALGSKVLGAEMMLKPKKSALPSKKEINNALGNFTIMLQSLQNAGEIDLLRSSIALVQEYLSPLKNKWQVDNQELVNLIKQYTATNSSARVTILSYAGMAMQEDDDQDLETSEEESDDQDLEASEEESDDQDLEASEEESDDQDLETSKRERDKQEELKDNGMPTKRRRSR